MPNIDLHHRAILRVNEHECSRPVAAKEPRLALVVQPRASDVRLIYPRTLTASQFIPFCDSSQRWTWCRAHTRSESLGSQSWFRNRGWGHTTHWAKVHIHFLFIAPSSLDIHIYLASSGNLSGSSSHVMSFVSFVLSSAFFFPTLALKSHDIGEIPL